MASKQIGELLNLKNNGELGRTLKRSEEIGQLTRALADALPEDLGASVLSASTNEEGTLEIRANSSAWAARLRFEEDTLLEVARQHGVDARSVRVRVGRPR